MGVTPSVNRTKLATTNVNNPSLVNTIAAGIAKHTPRVNHDTAGALP